jgi:hypothetical protein
VQWDPERTLHLDPLPWRTIQIGLGGPAMRHYVPEWITEITDITQTARSLRRLVDERDDTAAQRQLPVEKPYPLPPETAKVLGVSQLT